MDFENEERVVEKLVANLSYLETAVVAEGEKLDRANTTFDRTTAAQEILQLLAQAVQQKAHQRISEVVSSCLEAVFEDPYQFRIEFERKRGKTEARLRFSRRDLDVDPLTASGGGVVDVAAFALRVACLMLHRPRLSRVIVLDEPFRFVSEQYQDNVRTMLEKLSQEMGIQIVMVTHIDALATGQITRI